MKKSKLHHITRYDYDGVKAWWVRIQRGVGKTRRTFGKFLSDRKYGKRKGLLAAIRWRDANLPKHPTLPKRGMGRSHNPAGSYNFSRIFKSYRRVDGSVRKFEVFYVSFKPTKYTHVYYQVSISKWGVNTAQLMAEDWLRAQQKKRRRK